MESSADVFMPNQVHFLFPTFTTLIPPIAKHSIKSLRFPFLNLLPLRDLLSWEFSTTQSLGVDAFSTCERNVFESIPG